MKTAIAVWSITSSATTARSSTAPLSASRLQPPQVHSTDSYSNLCAVVLIIHPALLEIKPQEKHSVSFLPLCKLACLYAAIETKASSVAAPLFLRVKYENTFMPFETHKKISEEYFSCWLYFFQCETEE